MILELNYPKRLKIEKASIGSIISISSIIGFLLSLFSLFNFNDLEIHYKVIIILSLLLFISLVDIVILFIRDREKQYLQTTLDSYQNGLNKKIENIKRESDFNMNKVHKIQKQLNGLKKDLTT